jgi:hypothetical protein
MGSNSEPFSRRVRKKQHWRWELQGGKKVNRKRECQEAKRPEKKWGRNKDLAYQVFLSERNTCVEDL